jgi:hypothetical protein
MPSLRDLAVFCLRSNHTLSASHERETLVLGKMITRARNSLVWRFPDIVKVTMDTQESGEREGNGGIPVSTSKERLNFRILKDHLRGKSAR